ncbi:hypothetical protein SAMN04515671_0496 [Nakamurella panacisegetis]|uniref:Uncharacterized protein n=1 Tax=Nakamurella panacisegetis TaxID=1090615 RepID=A0A1H0IG99_9ACTN|nr:hypothetical protein SAMN04515671_0496 [Nakamurella panacisegetis]
MALGWVFVFVGWLLALASGLLWLRRYPGQRIGRNCPGTHTQGWKSWTLLAVGYLGFGVFGGERLQERYGGIWEWLIPFFLTFGLGVAMALPVISRMRILPRPH